MKYFILKLLKTICDHNYVNQNDPQGNKATMFEIDCNRYMIEQSVKSGFVQKFKIFDITNFILEVYGF